MTSSFQRLFAATSGIGAFVERERAEGPDEQARARSASPLPRDEATEPTQPREIVFKPSEFAYDYSKETIPTSDAGEKIRELLRRARPAASNAPSSVSKIEEDNDGDDENDAKRRAKRPRVEDFLKIPEKKVTPSLELDEKRLSPPPLVKSENDEKKDRKEPPSSVSTAFIVPKSARRVTSGLVQLHNEIVTFRDIVSPTPAERNERERVATVVTSLASELWPESRTTMFGSAATNLSLPHSDVDIVIHGGGGKRAIYEISRAFRARRMVEYMEVIDRARVPIIKLKFKETHFWADICFDEDGGPRTSRLINGVLERLPEVRPLVLIVKRFLAERELNDTFRGGMGSFLCFLTVVASVQRSRRLANPPLTPLSLGFMLLQYFDLFGNVLNYQDVGISLLEGGSFFSKRKRGWFSPERPFLLSIENPENSTLDVGKNSWAIENIKRAFSHAHRALLSAVTDFDTKESSSTTTSGKAGIGSRSGSREGGTVVLNSILSINDVLMDRF